MLSEELKKEILDLIKENLNQDSIEIGNSKTGVVKIYTNFDDLAKATAKIKNAIKVLKENRDEVLGGNQ